tara:strand:+ start:61 stop:402 length:342 start_codon:yes stop_codon:yes gene_type:complete
MNQKFQLIANSDTTFTPIEIIEEGKYCGLIYNYGKTELIEQDDQARLKFDYVILSNPNNIEEDQDFVNYIGDILAEILDKQLNSDGKLIPIVSNDEVDFIGNYREDNIIKSDS